MFNSLFEFVTELNSDGTGETAPPSQRTRAGTSATKLPSRTHEIGPLADVYALGAILYNLLTGRPPFRAESVLDTLRLVIEADPISPRLLNPTLDRDLETICLKCLEKDPQRRYPSALALASELLLYRTGMPIQARPISAPARLWRQCKRRPLVSSLAALFIASMLVGISVSSFFAVLANNRATLLQSTNSQLTVANETVEKRRVELQSTNEQLAAANITAERRRIAAEEASAVAREQSQLALKSLQSVIVDIQAKLRNVPGAGDLRRTLLQTALSRLQEVSDQFASRGAIDRNTAASLTELGDVFLRIGTADRNPAAPGSRAASDGPLAAARKVYQQAFDIAQKLAAADPSDAQAQSDLSISHIKLGDVLLKSGQVSEALGSYQKGVEIIQQLAAADPSDRQAQRDLSVSYNKLGNVKLQSGHASEALGSYQKGLEISQQLAAADPSDRQAQRDLSVSYNNLGDVQLKSGQVSEALGSYQKGLEIRQQLAAADPSDAQAQRDLSVSYNNLGDVQLKSGQVSEALGSYQKGLEIRQQLAAADPSDAQAQRDLSTSIERVGMVHEQGGKLTETREQYDRMLSIKRKLAENDPGDLLAQREYSVAYDHLGDVQLKSGHASEALGSYQKGLEIRQKLAAADPSDPQALRGLSISYLKVGDVLRHSGQVSEALLSYQSGLKIGQQLAAADPSNAQAQLDLVVSFQKVGSVEQKQRQYEQAIQSYDRAMNVLRPLQEQSRLPPANARWIPALEQLIQQCRHAAMSLGDWKTLLEQPPDLLPVLLEMRGTQFVQEGRTGDAVKAVATLRELGTATADQLYNVACVYSLCAAGIKPEKDEFTAEQAAERQKHIADALESLREAIEAGYKDFAHIQKDPDLAPLRDLPEFQVLLPK